MTVTETHRQRFWEKVERRGEDECWPWLASKYPNGYGQCSAVPGVQYAHHASLILHGKPRPEGAVTLHACNNPSCVNPAHLRWGTQAENMQQAIASGRASHVGRVAGEKNGNAKITPEIVASIRSDDRPQLEVAALHGISRQLVSAIKTRAAWKHLP